MISNLHSQEVSGYKWRKTVLNVVSPSSRRAVNTALYRGNKLLGTSLMLGLDCDVSNIIINCFLVTKWFSVFLVVTRVRDQVSSK